ncbi:transposase [Actinomyces oris]|uniref:Transposase n=1 Tax=Actinomyces oris TaxID=544580 RepID=A0AAW9KKZ4_9ACTO|nr:transposase [Actinomyces oris]MEA1305770.1 transposase [Actinomyces oris]
MVTADAMHTQVNTAGWIRDQGGHYVLTPLGNQKTLRRTLKNLSWKKVPSVSSVETGHGRRAAGAAHRPRPSRHPSGWTSPQRLRFSRSDAPGPSRAGSTLRWHTRVCSLPMEQAQPEQVAAWVQGHWGIENRLHVGS